MKIIPNDGYIVMYLSKTLRYAKEVVLAGIHMPMLY